jgi:hypothetical protein
VQVKIIEQLRTIDRFREACVSEPGAVATGSANPARLLRFVLILSLPLPVLTRKIENRRPDPDRFRDCATLQCVNLTKQEKILKKLNTAVLVSIFMLASASVSFAQEQPQWKTGDQVEVLNLSKE